MLTPSQIEQLRQLRAAGLRGVWAGDLIDKTSTRELVRLGLADNGPKGGADPSGLTRVYLTKRGQEELIIAAMARMTDDEVAEAIDKGWSEF
jgi:hypothetical protein